MTEVTIPPTPKPWQRFARWVPEHDLWLVFNGDGELICTGLPEADARLLVFGQELLAAAEEARRELHFCVHVAGRTGGGYEAALNGLTAAIAAVRG